MQLGGGRIDTAAFQDDLALELVVAVGWGNLSRV